MKKFLIRGEIWSENTPRLCYANTSDEALQIAKEHFSTDKVFVEDVTMFRDKYISSLAIINESITQN